MSLDLTTPKKPGETIKINMQGYGLGLQTVAFQSDVLNALDHYHLTGVIQNPVMSDPSSDAKSRVTFGFTAEIDPSSLKYKDTVATGDILTNAPPSNSAAPATPAAPQVDQSTPFGR